nr:hypothetical protein [Candidatus Sigynarchaeota archaeon]
MSQYRRNDVWNIQYEKGVLVMNAGADCLYAIEDVSNYVAKEIIDAWTTNFAGGKEFTPRARDVIEELKSAGIVLIRSSAPASLKIKITFIGDESLRLRDLIADKASKTQEITLTTDPGNDFILFIRTNGQLKDLIPLYKNVTIPHLLVDLAYHHTVSIGPLVIPPETACLSCLVGRITNLWGDPVPPKQPLIQADDDLIAGIVIGELKKIAGGNQSLVNKTVSFNFTDYKVQKDALYKLPWCPECNRGEVDNKIGAIDLPWTKGKQ